MTSSKKILLPGMASAIATVGLLGGCGIFGGGVIECDDTLGVCPRPDPGIVMDDGGFEKSVWAEGGSLTRPVFQYAPEFQPALCFGDVDQAEGNEVIFKGEGGFLIFDNAPSAPSTLAEVSIANMLAFNRKTLFVDTDADGDVEYLRFLDFDDDFEERFVTLMNHDGSRRWRRTMDTNTGNPFDRLDGDYLVLGDWAAADVNTDGTVEFAFTTEHGVDVIRADGSTLATIGTEFYSWVEFADIDGDDEFELITVKGDTVTTWGLDGREISSFESTELTYGRGIVRIDGENPVDRIRIRCNLFDSEGVEVGSVEPGEFGLCRANDSSPLDAFVLDECHDVQDTHTVERTVRFEKDRDAYRVELSYSYRTQVPFIAGLFSSQPTRCIIRIFDPDGQLKYHEVLNSGSAPDSAVVIPSDVEGEEILLVADDTRILAYRIRRDGT